MALLTQAIPTAPAGADASSARVVPAAPKSTDVTELRLALVCDGGVSLAIYIHGVVKELQNVIRAARAYDRHLSEGGSNPSGIIRGLTGNQLNYFDALLHAPKKYTVIIDVISGTSAGGINGIFLAKALTQNLSQAPLTDLWLDRADLKLLAHQHLPGQRGAIIGSVVALLFHLNSQNWGPLDGDLMCRWLLEALATMDRAPRGAADEPSLLSEGHDLDLLVTSTALRGAGQLFPSPDGGRGEHARTNRKVWRFNSGTTVTDARFGEPDSPGLAFVARCTSSFPGAFAPICLGHFTDIAAAVSAGFDQDAFTEAFTKDQLVEYVLAGQMASTVSFADGGLLDNSPFDLTIAAIAAKSAEGQVERQIIHIDPDPGDWPTVGTPGPLETQPAPTWIGGVTSALGVLTSQTVFGDLVHLQELNNTISQVGSITADLQSRVLDELHDIDRDFSTTIPSWERAATIGAEVHTRVPAVAGTLNAETYRRLKIATIAQMIAEDLAGTLDYPTGTRQAALLRSAFTAWLDTSAFLAQTPETIADFLDSIDMPYRERRLRFLISGVNGLFRTTDDPAQLAALRRIKSRCWTILNGLLHFRAEAARNLPAAVTSFLLPDELDTADALAGPEQFITAHAQQFTDLIAAYQHALGDYRTVNPAKQLWADFITYTADLPAKSRVDILSRYVGFPLWDALIYPVIALSKLPQLSPIASNRISPQDANRLKLNSNESKLRGTSAHHFGGFFKREYRENDYLWGRLDTAEIVLHMLGHHAESAQTTTALTTILDDEEPHLKTIGALISRLRKQLSMPPAEGAG